MSTSMSTFMSTNSYSAIPFVEVYHAVLENKDVWVGIARESLEHSFSTASLGVNGMASSWYLFVIRYSSFIDYLSQVAIPALGFKTNNCRTLFCLYFGNLEWTEGNLHYFEVSFCVSTISMFVIFVISIALNSWLFECPFASLVWLFIVIT